MENRLAVENFPCHQYLLGCFGDPMRDKFVANNVFAGAIRDYFVANNVVGDVIHYHFVAHNVVVDASHRLSAESRCAKIRDIRDICG